MVEPIPHPGAEFRLNDRARSTLALLCETLVRGSSQASGGAPTARPAGEGLEAIIERLLVEDFSPTQRDGFARLLRSLENPVLNLLIAGRGSRFSTLGGPAREALLLRWANSWSDSARSGFQAVKRLTTFLYYASAPPEGTHPTWGKVGYQLAPSAPGAELAEVIPALRPRAFERDSELRVDACVVGSGAGGSVIAAYLARAGYKVAILEAGPFRTAADFPRNEAAAYRDLFDGKGLLGTSDLAFAVLAGRMVGGSTTVNWMTCLRPDPTIRAEWEGDFGLAGLTGPEFESQLAAIERRLAVTTDSDPDNPPNAALRRGCERLGYQAGVDFASIPRNAAGCDGRCAPCAFGCPYEAKLSAESTYLSDALRWVATLVCDAHVDQVDHASGRATGVTATVKGPRGTTNLGVRSRAVVLAGGAVQTPALLRRSGVGNPSVGRHLHLHPTTAVFGEFPDRMSLWAGPMQTVLVRRFQPTDPVLHGPWIESAPAHPGLAALGLPWQGSTAHREAMERLDHAAASIALVRDVGEGRVRIDPQGRPLLSYRLDHRDRENLVRGIQEAARLQRAAGAERITTLHQVACEVGSPGSPISEPAFERFLEQVRSLGVRENRIMLFSAHPTGSARLGPDPRTAAADPSGEVYGLSNAFIGDGGALPSAPGVNPMLAIMAFASRTAESVARRLAVPA
jgi:choline dehydrogenase-like flavoprotein